MSLPPQDDGMSTSRDGSQPSALPPLVPTVEAIPSPGTATSHLEPQPAETAGSLGGGKGGSSSAVANWANRVMTEVEKVFVGQRELVRGTLIALLSGGHVLLESPPGLGKTLLVRTLGSVLGCRFGRLQFTPDLMPADVTGSSIFDPQRAEFRFRPGPIFTQLLLADEINRAPAKTQSALLEIMQESRVTVDGVTHALELPFLVLATQNPIESEGTYNLPEAQLDRFLFKLTIDYPGQHEETAILRLHTQGQSPDRMLSEQVGTVTQAETVLKAQRACSQIRVDDRILNYMTSLIRATRSMETVFSLGASPRAGVALLKASQAAAALESREFVLPDDVQGVLLPTLRHRVQLTPEAELEGRQVDDLLGELIRRVEVPRG